MSRFVTLVLSLVVLSSCYPTTPSSDMAMVDDLYVADAGCTGRRLRRVYSYSLDCGRTELVNALWDSGYIVVTAAYTDMVVPAYVSCVFTFLPSIRPAKLDWKIQAKADAGFGGGVWWTTQQYDGGTYRQADNSDFRSLDTSGTIYTRSGQARVGLSFNGVTTLTRFYVTAQVTP